MKNPFVSPILAPYVEITVLSCPNFVGKTFIFSKKLCYHVIKKKSHKKSLALMPVYDEKMPFC